MGARLRAHDWRSSPLGEPAHWPQALRTLVGLMLASEQPMFIAWGPEQTWLYNDAFAPILGGKHPAALGRPALREVWSEAHEVLKPLFDRVFSGEPVHMDDFGLMLDRHGRLEEAHFAFSYTPVRNDSGGIDGLFGACIETTDRILADRRKDEFIAMLAHELRNPLAPLRNALHLARHGGQSGNDVLLGMMERQVDHMVRMVDDLLDVARISQGKIALRLETVDLMAIIDSALETTAPALQQAGCTVSVSAPASPVLVEGDAERLAQVLCNLVGNAAKFSDPGGEIRIALSKGGGEIVLEVRDDGVGIPPDKLEQVFDMFCQLDQSLERSSSGLGLGLPMARQIVRLHGGSIAALSAGRGCGTTFTVRLPPAAAGQVVPVKPALEPAEPSPRRILIADDNRDSADTMGMLLSAGGHEVQVVYNGRDALETATRLRPDVMLLDIGMPGMNGYDVARAARQQPWSASTVIIAMTGWGQERDKERSREAGIDHHLIKPVELNTLQRAVSGAAGGPP